MSSMSRWAGRVLSAAAAVAVAGAGCGSGSGAPTGTGGGAGGSAGASGNGGTAGTAGVTGTGGISPLPEGNTGIASRHPGDVGIGSDADVIFADDFEGYARGADLSNRW